MFPAPGRDFHILDAEADALARPQFVRIPDVEVRTSLRPGCFAKIMLNILDGPSEKFWVLVDSAASDDEGIRRRGQ